MIKDAPLPYGYRKAIRSGDAVEGIHWLLVRDPYCRKYVPYKPANMYKDDYGNFICLDCWITQSWKRNRQLGKYIDKRRLRLEIGASMNKDFPKSILGL